MKNSGREIKVEECKRCGWKWSPRKKEIIICPKCKSPYWNKEKNASVPKRLRERSAKTLSMVQLHPGAL